MPPGKTGAAVRGAGTRREAPGPGPNLGPAQAPPKLRPSPPPESLPGPARPGPARTPAAPRAGHGSWRQQLCGPFWPSLSAFEGSHGSAHALVTTTVPRRGSLRAGQNQGREGADLFVRSANWGTGPSWT